MKKSFKDNNPAMKFITQTEHDTQQETEPEAQVVPIAPIVDNAQDELQETPCTPKRKRKRMQRINMAFTAENLEYLQIISWYDRMSATAYVNKLIKADLAIRAEDVIKAKTIYKGD